MARQESHSANRLRIFGPDEGQVQAAEGVLISNDVNESFKENRVFTIEAPSGEQARYAGATQLNEKMAPIPLGAYVWITFRGMKPTRTGKSFKDFTVEFDTEDVLTPPADDDEDNDGLPF